MLLLLSLLTNKNNTRPEGTPMNPSAVLLAAQPEKRSRAEQEQAALATVTATATVQVTLPDVKCSQ